MSKASQYKEAITQASTVKPNGCNIITKEGTLNLEVTGNETAILQLSNDAIKGKIELDIAHLRTLKEWIDDIFFKEG